jgi:hypothetical protein
MPSWMGHGAHGLGIDKEVELESSQVKIVPKSDEGWKDHLGQFDRSRCGHGVGDRKVSGWWSGWE